MITTRTAAAAADAAATVDIIKATVASAEATALDSTPNASSAPVATEAARSGMHTAAELTPTSVTRIATADGALAVNARQALKVTMRKTVDNITGSVHMTAEVLPGKWVVSSEPAGQWASGEL